MARIKNALTIDVEDYFHVSAFTTTIRKEEWERYPCRVEQNTAKILELLAECSVEATFFILGWVAERYPRLVKDIAAAGHEIACHGLTHELVYNQSPEVFRAETLKAKLLLEDIAQTPVRGYRAASYSIVKRSIWALDILADLGFLYDSSIYPIRHDRYGMPGTERSPHFIQLSNARSIIEYPLSTANYFGISVPVAGGGYFRMFPYWLTKAALARINSSDLCPFIFYLHPWEIDVDQPRIPASWISRFRHYTNIEICEKRLRRLLRDFEFEPAVEVLEHAGFLFPGHHTQETSA